jgi:hypothetical protein
VGDVLKFRPRKVLMPKLQESAQKLPDFASWTWAQRELEEQRALGL